MESCIMIKMTHKSILLSIVILFTCSIGESEGFFLKKILPETRTDELQISTTTISPATTSTDSSRVFDEIHRNVSEKLEESSTQIVNSVKEIVSLVLDEHTIANETQHILPEESSQTDIKLRNIAIDGDNDIPATEALITNLEHDSNDPALSIVKIPEANNEDIATTLEYNIRSSVKDEIQLEQNLESSAIDGIPDPEVRQTLTEDLMAMEYPQSVKKLEENRGDVVPSVTNEEDKVVVTETPIEVTTGAIINETSWVPNTTIPPKEDISLDSTDPAEVTANPVFEAETESDVEVTTPSIEIFQEITSIPSEEIVQSLVDLPEVPLDAKPIRTRHRRGFNEESDTNEVLPESHESSRDQISSTSSISKSSDSSSSSASSDDSSSKASTKKKPTTKDENVAAEDTSEEVDEVISQDASIEESLEKENAVTTISIPSKKVTPTPRPSITSTTTIPMEVTTVESDISDPIIIDNITESTGEVLSEVAATTGDGKHIVIKKPGVDEELNTAEKPFLEENNGTSDDVNLKPELGTIADADSTVSHVLNTTAVSAEETDADSTVSHVLNTTAVSAEETDADSTVSHVLNTTAVSAEETDADSTVSHVLNTTAVSAEETDADSAVSHVLNKTAVSAEEADADSTVSHVLNTTAISAEEADADSTVSHVLNTTAISAEEAPKMIENGHLSTEILNDNSPPEVTENHLFEAEEPIIHSESNDFVGKAKSIDLDPLTASKITEIYDNNTEQASVPELEETLTTESEKKSTKSSDPRENESLPIIDQKEKEDTYEQISDHTPTPQTILSTLINEQPNLPQDDHQVNSLQPNTTDLLRTLDIDDNISNQPPTSEIPSKILNAETTSVTQITLDTNDHKYSQTFSSEVLIPEIEEGLETSTEASSFPLEKVQENRDIDITSKPSFANEISKHVDETPSVQTPEPSPKEEEEQLQTHYLDTFTYETSTEKPTARSNEDLSSPAIVKTLIEAAELTTEFARHVDSFRTTRDENGAVSDEIISSAAAGRSFNAIVAEGLGKPLPTRSVGDEPSSSSYSSEDKTNTVVVLCSSAAVVFIAFSIAIYLITFQRQHGTLDIEMQEQRCGKDDLEDEEDAETRVTLLNQFPQVDSDEHSSD